MYRKAIKDMPRSKEIKIYALMFFHVLFGL